MGLLLPARFYAPHSPDWRPIPSQAVSTPNTQVART